MITKRLVMGAQAKFFREGVAATISDPASPGYDANPAEDEGGDSSRDYKPGATDTGWLPLGNSRWKKKNTGTTETLKAPVPGAYTDYEVVPLTRGMKITATLKEVSNLIYGRLLHGADVPDTGAGGDFVPLEEDCVINGWLKLSYYDQFNVIIDTVDVWVAMMIPGDVEADEKGTDIDVECTVLYSTLNNGTLR